MATTIGTTFYDLSYVCMSRHVAAGALLGRGSAPCLGLADHLSDDAAHLCWDTLALPIESLLGSQWAHWA
jgi:hypothetical protein